MGNSVKSNLKPGLGESEIESRRLQEQLKQVKEKLKKANKGTSKKGENELQDLAEKLLDKEKTKKEFFGHLLEHTEEARQVVSGEQKTFPRGFPNYGTRNDSEQRMAEPLRKLEAKLILHELKDGRLIQQMANSVAKHVDSFTFGPFHASILVSDVILEWRPNSLVIPYRIGQVDDKDHKAVLFTNLHETSVSQQLPTVPLHYEPGVDQDTVAMTFEQIKGITREKDQLIDELADIVVRYNTKMHYGIFTNNCQHFVKDVLTVLGITNPEEVFRGKIKQHADLVVARARRESIVEFNSHQELDNFIQQQNIDEMSRDDLEFAYCHYLLFHVWGQRFPHEEAWRCTPDKCQASAVGRRVH